MNISTQNIFKALADPTRRDILKMLSRQDMTIADVTTHFGMTRAAIKKHLTVLNDGGLITVEAHGRKRINRINHAGFTPVLTWLEYFDTLWDDRLAVLKSTIEKDIT